MPRKPATAPESKAAGKARPARKIATKAVRTKAAPTRAPLKATLKAAAKALARPPARKPATKAAGKPAVRLSVLERAPIQDARPVLVRDSFTMPEQEYAVLLEVKKSELLRIGVALLGQLDVDTLQGVLAALPQLKTGRPPAQG